MRKEATRLNTNSPLGPLLWGGACSARWFQWAWVSKAIVYLSGGIFWSHNQVHMEFGSNQKVQGCMKTQHMFTKLGPYGKCMFVFSVYVLLIYFSWYLIKIKFNHVALKPFLICGRCPGHNFLLGGQKAAKWRYEAGWMVCTGLPLGGREIFSLNSDALWRGLPRWLSGKESFCQCRRHRRYGFDSWVRKIPWRSTWQTHSSILAWRIPWTEEPGGLQSSGSQRIGHGWATEQACMPFGEENVCTRWLIGANLTLNRAGLTLLKNVFPVSLKFWPLTSAAMGPTSFLHISPQTPSDLSYTDRKIANRAMFFLRVPLLLQRALWSLGKKIIPLFLVPGEKMSYLDSLPPKCLWVVDLNMYNIHGQRGQLQTPRAKLCHVFSAFSFLGMCVMWFHTRNRKLTPLVALTDED